jgi:rhamnosyltransferase subunit B
MHAILVSMGTDGDIFPYVGLGAKLRARGHRVTLSTNESYQSLAENNGFTFQALVSNAEADEFLAHPDLWHPLKCGLHGARWGVRYLRRQYELLEHVASEKDAVLVANAGVVAARIVSEKLSKPIASLVLQPGIIPSAIEPPVMTGLTLPRWAPRWAGKLYWRLINAAGDLLVGHAINRLRSSVGLKPMRQIFQWWLSPQLVIGMFPDWYGPPQDDWPSQMRLAGFPMFDGPATGDQGSEALAFCAEGTPPIAFTLGTGMQHAAEFFREALAACRILGRRGILLTKYPQQLPNPLPIFLRHASFVPFQKLFPLCAAVVHHGGIGTTAKALAAGTPQLVLPLAWDQPDNGLRVKRLGAGDSLGPRHRSGARLAQALKGVMTPETQARCRELAGRFGKTDALDVAAEWLEELSRGHDFAASRQKTSAASTLVSG